ncbi:unnamed protein product, partial [Meganyctiphanes norvegica]
HHALPDGRLLVHAVSSADSFATYRCHVLHALTQATALSPAARITVHDPRETMSPRMVTKSDTLQQIGSQSLVVPCVAHGHPVPQYRWYQNRGGMQVALPPTSVGIAPGSMTRTSTPQGSSDEGVLLLEPGRLQDTVAIITCEADNSAGRDTMEIRVERSTMGLIVTVQPQVLVVDSGTEGRLHCLLGPHHLPP